MLLGEVVHPLCDSKEVLNTCGFTEGAFHLL